VRISEVSRRSGIPATALRYYESIGLISARRTSNGYRQYDHDVLARLDLIEASKELDLPLDDIAAHLNTMQTSSCTDVRDNLQPLLAERLHQLDQKLARLKQLRQRLATADNALAACPDRSETCSTECVFAHRPERPAALRPPSPSETRDQN